MIKTTIKTKLYKHNNAVLIDYSSKLSTNLTALEIEHFLSAGKKNANQKFALKITTKGRMEEI